MHQVFSVNLLKRGAFTEFTHFTLYASGFYANLLKTEGFLQSSLILLFIHQFLYELILLNLTPKEYSQSTRTGYI